MAVSSLHQFCEWLASTKASATIQDASWVIPTVQTLHIACIAVLIGSVVMLDMRMFGIAGRGDSIAATAKRLLPWIWWPLPVFLATGLILIVAEPSRELENATFYNKMILLVFAIATTGLLQGTLHRNPVFWEGSRVRSGAAKGLATVSLALFVGIVFAGRLIAYTDHP